MERQIKNKRLEELEKSREGLNKLLAQKKRTAPVSEPKTAPKTRQQERIERIDESYDANNPDFVTPVIPQRKSLKQIEPLEGDMVSKVPEILDGEGKNNLMESMRVFKLESGDRVYAGTDIGVNRKRNEDRVVICPPDNSVFIVDGHGMGGRGKVAAEILAESFMKSPTNVNEAISEARKKMGEQRVEEGGAVFSSARIITQEQQDKSIVKGLDMSNMGDANLIIIKKDGTIDFESRDQSVVDDLVNSKTITSDEALYHERRNEVIASVSPDEKAKEDGRRFYFARQVEEGDLVLLCSDGISDNFTAEEIAEEIARERKLGAFSPERLFSWLSDASGARMRNVDYILGKPKEDGRQSPEQLAKIEERKRTGVFSDGYKSAPKPDNRALAIIEIKGGTEKVKVSTELDGLRQTIENTKRELEQQIIDEKKDLALIEDLRRQLREINEEPDEPSSIVKGTPETDSKSLGEQESVVADLEQQRDHINEELKKLLAEEEKIKRAVGVDSKGWVLVLNAVKFFGLGFATIGIYPAYIYTRDRRISKNIYRLEADQTILEATIISEKIKLERQKKLNLIK